MTLYQAELLDEATLQHGLLTNFTDKIRQAREFRKNKSDVVNSAKKSEKTRKKNEAIVVKEQTNSEYIKGLKANMDRIQTQMSPLKDRLDKIEAQLVSLNTEKNTVAAQYNALKTEFNAARVKYQENYAAAANANISRRTAR